MEYEQLKLENQVCFRLYTAARFTMGAYHPYLDPLGITYPQYLVLLVLWEKGKQPVNDIAHKLLLHRHATPATHGESGVSQANQGQGRLASAYCLVDKKRYRDA